MLATISGSLDQQLLLRNDYLVSENRSWGYRRIVGALSNLGYEVSHQTVGNVLQRHGLLPAPDRERKTSWREFIRSHTEVLAAVDFFTSEKTLTGQFRERTVPLKSILPENQISLAAER